MINKLKTKNLLSSKKMKKQKKINRCLKILEKKYPSTSMTTLNRMRTKPKPYHILISCLLSLRARDENTEKVSEQLFAVADTPEEISKMPIKKLERLIFSSGHYHKKAQTLKHVSKELLKRFNGKVPKTREELLSIKGIGPKTANIVLAFAFNKAVIPVDTHCHRIPNRLGWIKTKTPEKTEEELNKMIPEKQKMNFNAIFVQFGREICQPISPWCSKCPIMNYCSKMNIKKSR
jgi:endonuclease-3